MAWKSKMYPILIVWNKEKFVVSVVHICITAYPFEGPRSSEGAELCDRNDSLIHVDDDV
jgi:hypothetical protein